MAFDSSAYDLPVRRKSRLSVAVNDLGAGLGRTPLWLALAWNDISHTYKRSAIGVLWVTLSFAFFIIAKLVIFGPMMGGGAANRDAYIVYLMLGFLSWTYISNIISSAPNVFTAAEGFIKNDPLPLSLFVYRLIARNLFNTLLMGLVVVGVMAVLQRPITWNAFLVIPAIALYLVNSVWLCLLLGVACTRYRDLTHVISTLMRVMMFLVPIFWYPEQIGGSWPVLKWNPLTHFIIILRSPVDTGEIHMQSWAYVGAVTVVGWATALAFFARFRHRIVFWF